jgi:hypothetical protein
MHGDVDDAAQNRKDLILRLLPLLVLEVLVPKRMSKEVQPNMIGSTLE